MEYKNHPNIDIHFPRHVILNSNFYVQNIEDIGKLMRITFPKIKKTDKKDTCKQNQPKDICPIFKCLSFIKRWFCHFPENSSSTSTLCHHFKTKPRRSTHQSSTKTWKGNISVRCCWGCRNWSMHYAYRN